MRAPRGSRRFAAGAALIWTIGSACAAPFATLDGVLVESRPARPDELGRVRVFRQGQARDAEPRMAIEKADRLTTTSDGVALLTLNAGYQVILEPGTDLTIENPSILVRIGKIIVKTLREVKEKLTVNSEFVSAGVEGTEFVYEVTRDRAVQIAVVEGSVTVEGRGWQAVTYRSGETGTIRAGAPPSRMGRLDPAAIRAIRQRIAEVESAARPIVPDLRGERQAVARALLEARGLELGRVSTVLTREVPSGTILRTRPAAGTLSRLGDRVTIEVADSGLVVPSVLGNSLSQATRALRTAGLGPPDTTSVYQPNARAGTVVGVAPSEGAIVSIGTRVVLTIARTAAPPAGDTARPPTSCKVPNLRGMTESQANRALESARLRTGRVQRLELGTTVTQQGQAAGTTVRCGSSVDFTIGTIG